MDLNADLSSFAPTPSETYFPIATTETKQTANLQSVALPSVGAFDNTVLNKSQQILSNAQELVKQMDTETDPNKLGQMLMQLQGSLAATKADFYKAAETSALAKYGIDGLQKNLQAMELKDRAHPTWSQHPYDSNQTARARELLLTNTRAAFAEINNSLTGNTTYNELLAQEKTLTELASIKVSSRIRKNEANDMAGEQFAQSLGPEGKARADILFPQFKDSPSALKGFIDGMPKKDMRDATEIALRVNKSDLPSVALAGNNVARAYLQNQVAVPNTIVRSALSEGFAIADSPDAAKKAFEDLKARGAFGTTKDADLASYTIAFNKSAKLAEATPTEQKKMIEAARIRIAEKYIQEKTVSQFNSDVTRLQSTVPIPSFLTEAASDPKVNSNGIDLAKAVELATQSKDKQLVQLRMNELQNYYTGAVNTFNQNGLIQIPITEIGKIKAAAGMTILGAGLDYMKQLINGPVNLVGTMALTPLNILGDALTSPIDELQKPIWERQNAIENAVNKSLPAGVTVEDMKKKPIPGGSFKFFGGSK